LPARCREFKASAAADFGFCKPPVSADRGGLWYGKSAFTRLVGRNAQGEVMIKLSKLVLMFSLLFAAVCGMPAFANGDDDAMKIAAINQQWLDVVAKKDAAATANIYAEDGSILAPGAPIMTGRPAVEGMWKNLYAIPGFGLTFATTNLKLADAHDMAVDVGTYTLTTGEGAAKKEQKGKYVVTWVKNDGQWQVYTDMFSPDAP
jgi:uncharacterized protein (TIGR02246 family)